MTTTFPSGNWNLPFPDGIGSGFDDEQPNQPRRLRPMRTPSRLFAFEDGSLPTDESLSRLLRMSLHSLRGYLEIVDLDRPIELTEFARVMVHQRYAQCRQLTSYIERSTYSPIDSDRGARSARMAWIRAIAELDQGNERRSIEHIMAAEQRLQDACLETSIEISWYPLPDTLREYAVNICGAHERLEDLLNRNGRSTTSDG